MYHKTGGYEPQRQYNVGIAVGNHVQDMYVIRSIIYSVSSRILGLGDGKEEPDHTHVLEKTPWIMLSTLALKGSSLQIIMANSS